MAAFWSWGAPLQESGRGGREERDADPSGDAELRPPFPDEGGTENWFPCGGGGGPPDLGRDEVPGAEVLGGIGIEGGGTGAGTDRSDFDIFLGGAPIPPRDDRRLSSCPLGYPDVGLRACMFVRTCIALEEEPRLTKALQF